MRYWLYTHIHENLSPRLVVDESAVPVEFTHEQRISVIGNHAAQNSQVKLRWELVDARTSPTHTLPR